MNSERVRSFAFVLAASVFGIVLLRAVIQLPDFGHYAGPYGDVLNSNAVTQRKATNVIAAVNFDYRAIDTLGEEFILFAAVMGVALLLREQKGERRGEAVDVAEDRRTPHDSDSVRELCLGLVAPATLFGLYVVAHGHLTPGGGFQGGVLLATAPLLMYLGGEYMAFRRLSPEKLTEAGESTGAAIFVIIGLIALVVAGSFLENFLPLGKPSDLNSSGTIMVINLSVGLAVASGLLLLLSDFLEQTLEIHRRKSK
jgi:multicomponent Na+:H+ antiporter subunit B